MQCNQISLFDNPVDNQNIELLETADNPISDLDQLLSNFDELEMTVDNRISEADRKFCEEKQKEFNEYLEFHKKHYAFLRKNALYNKYVSTESLIMKNSEKRDEAAGRFVDEIFWYFQKTYNITLQTYEVKKKYDHTVTYQLLLEEIFEQLGGYSFVEKEAEEIKGKVKKHLRRWNEASVKGCKVTLPRLVYIEDGYKKGKIRVNYHSQETLTDILKGVMHYERGMAELGYSFNDLIDNRCKPQEDLIREHIFDWFNKFRSLRPYKNGTVVLKFSSIEYAEEFAREYCGWIKGEPKSE